MNDTGSPSDTGRYIIIDFPDVGWGDGGGTNDGGYTFDSAYTITYKGAEIDFVDGSSILPEGFTQTGVVSPVLDNLNMQTITGLIIVIFITKMPMSRLPLVVFFHGGGQGNDIYTPIRFSNGGTIWANPENQSQVASIGRLRNATTTAAMHNVKAVIDQMIAEGKVDL